MSKPSQFRAAGRGLLLSGHLLSGAIQEFGLVLRYGAAWHQTPRGIIAVSRWMQRLSRIIGLQVQTHSLPMPAPVMLVANHVSWLDIIAIAGLCPARFLAKDTVRRWPLIGMLAALSGTLFIRRETASALRKTNLMLAQCLTDGQRVVIFPEGTTTDGKQMQEFKSALFEAARMADCPVQPLAISYQRDGETDLQAPYYGNDTFVTHLWRIMSLPETTVQLHFCPVIADNSSRKVVARASHACISETLSTYRYLAAQPLATATEEMEVWLETETPSQA